eukprot:4067056-Amphidinium_carterae.1
MRFCTKAKLLCSIFSLQHSPSFQTILRKGVISFNTASQLSAKCNGSAKNNGFEAACDACSLSGAASAGMVSGHRA